MSNYEDEIMDYLSDALKAIANANVYKGYYEFNENKNKKKQLDIFIISGDETFANPYEANEYDITIDFTILARYIGDIDFNNSETFFNKQIEIENLIKHILMNLDERRVSSCQEAYLNAKQVFRFYDEKIIQIYYDLKFKLKIV